MRTLANVIIELIEDDGGEQKISVKITGEAKRHEVVGILEYVKAEVIRAMIFQLDAPPPKCED